jgi:glucosamine-6-phosphate deaminase
MEVIFTSNYEKICESAARIIHREWRIKKNLVLGLATGQTPLGVYKELIKLHQKKEIDFSPVRTFSLDEYLGLEEDHPQSFALYLKENFLKHLNIKKENIFRLDGKPSDIDTHCREYEERIKSCGGIDVQILGIGRNGHIGFNEPGSSLSSRTRVKTLAEETVRDNARFFENKQEVPRFCLTMGIGTVMEAKMIILLASGDTKKDAVRQCVEGAITASVPASVLQLHPQVKIIVDEDAGALLSRKDYYTWIYQNKERVKDYLK